MTSKLKFTRKLSLSLLFLIASVSVLQAREADVTFFVIGKHANFYQDETGEQSPVDYSFFSEIFLSKNGDASNAYLRFPGGARTAFKDQRDAEAGKRDNLLLVSGKERYSSFADLQADYPDGEYQISFTTPSVSVRSGKLLFTGGSLPTAPRIMLRQGDRTICSVVNPASDLHVSWSPFSDGGPDPREVLDDLIFVILTDDDGTRNAHSGRPFEGKPHLTYAAGGFTVLAGSLKSDQSYTVSVEHAVLDDTRMYSEIPAMTTLAVTTTLAISTGNTNPEADQNCMTDRRAPSIDSQTIMFYYEDLAAPASFYGTALGLEQTLDWSWVKMFRTSPDSTVGLVLEGEGAYHKAQPQNAVMLSLVTDEVDAWYRRLKARNDVKFLKEIQDGGGIRSFLLEDPGGYTVEFFQWLDSTE